MRVTAVSSAGHPGRPNEDFTGAVPGAAVLDLDRADAPLVVTDPREVVISGSYEPALEAAAGDAAAYGRILRDLRAHRNAPGGFWLAKDDPRAADEAVTGSVPIAGLTAAALLSNGAARVVERFRLAGWPEVMSALASTGPAGVIDRVRQAEASGGVPSDDATITHCTAFTAPCVRVRR